MELSPWLIYVILQMDHIILMCVLIMSLAPLFTWLAVLLCSYSTSFLTEAKWNLFPVKIGGVIFGVALLLSAFLPTTKTLTGMYVLPAIVSNEDVQALPSELAKAVRTIVKEWTITDAVKE